MGVFFSGGGGKSHIEYLGDLIPMVSMVIGPTKFIGDIKLDPRSCSRPSRGATSTASLWWKAVEGQKSHHRGNLRLKVKWWSQIGPTELFRAVKGCKKCTFSVVEGSLGTKITPKG